LLVSKEEDLK